MNLLQLHQGCKHYGSKTLFEDARFAVNDGEHVGVIGPNGAGKTTLFKILVGHETLDSGDLIKSQKLKIGYLEQEAKEPLDQSAEEYLTNNSLKPIWELKQLGQDLGLSESHFAVPFHQLSGGYRMRMSRICPKATRDFSPPERTLTFFLIASPEKSREPAMFKISCDEISFCAALCRASKTVSFGCSSSVTCWA